MGGPRPGPQEQFFVTSLERNVSGSPFPDTRPPPLGIPPLCCLPEQMWNHVVPQFGGFGGMFYSLVWGVPWEVPFSRNTFLELNRGGPFGPPLGDPGQVPRSSFFRHFSRAKRFRKARPGYPNPSFGDHFSSAQILISRNRGPQRTQKMGSLDGGSGGRRRVRLGASQKHSCAQNISFSCPNWNPWLEKKSRERLRPDPV